LSVPVILDTDIGSDIDDVYALVLAMKHPEIDLVGVTTVGNFPHSRARLAAKILRLGGREDVGVYAGNAVAGPQQPDAPPIPAKGDTRRYTDLVGSDDPEHNRYYGDAVDFILATLDTASEPVTIVGIGGWTNVAEVIRRAQPHQLERIGLIAMMGGEVHTMRRESNAAFDPAATRTVLTAELPTFVATWSVSRKVTYSMAEIDDLMRGQQSPLMSEIHRGTNAWFNPRGLKPGPVCYDVVPLFWAAGERDAFTCIKLRSIPVESHGLYTSGMTVCEPWTIERAERTSETSSSYNTVTHDLDENVLKAKLNELVFARA
jgi:purine nucleosidase